MYHREDNNQIEFECITIKSNNMVIKKSSLCWLIDYKLSRISNDRLRRFINKTKQNTILIFKRIQTTKEPTKKNNGAVDSPKMM